MIMREAMQKGLHQPHNFAFTVVFTEGVQDMRFVQNSAHYN
jgi:hypothetical protein